MLSVVTIVLPVFGVIFAGYLSRKINLLGSAASSGLSSYVVYLALPAMLFDIMAKASWDDLYLPGFTATFGIGCLVVYGLALTIMLLFGLRKLPDASIDGLAAAYPNSGYMGFPLCLLVLGEASLPAVTIAAAVISTLLLAVSVILFEAGMQQQRQPHVVMIKVVRALAFNPLLLAPALGALVGAAGWKLPEGVDAFLRLLGASASPCALVALGLLLAEASARSDGWSLTVLLTVSKLAVQPAITWVLAYHVFTVPQLHAQTAVLLAALPTGTGPFMVAELYKREAAETSTVVLLSTVLSVATVSLLVHSAVR